MPGKYTAKLTVEGKTYTQPLAVKMDPRIKTSEADLYKQFEMEAGAVEGMNESYEALRQVQSLRAQIKDRAGKAKGALADSISALEKQAAELEGASQSAFFGLPSSGKQPENFSTLNQHFAALLAVADSADAAPTTQASAAYFGDRRRAREISRPLEEDPKHRSARLELLVKEVASSASRSEPTFALPPVGSPRRRRRALAVWPFV